MWKYLIDLPHLPALVVLSVTACSQLPSGQPPTDTMPATEIDANPEVSVAPDEPDVVADGRAPSGHSRLSLLEQGNSGFIANNMPEDRQSGSDSGGINLNLQDTDIREFAQVVLNDVLNENYVIDEKVGGTVTINTVKPINKETALALLEDILGMHGAAIIKKKRHLPYCSEEPGCRQSAAGADKTNHRRVCSQDHPIEIYRRRGNAKNT